MRVPVILLAMLSLRAQSLLSPDLEALTKIRTRMLYNLAHEPNYTCVETIERSSRAKSTNKLKIVDTLRLEVALVDGREMFAWPGSKKFDEFDLTTMVTTGAIGTGDFGSHARALFSGRSATFYFRGEEDFQGKKAIRFDYKVPQMLSGYKIRVATASAIVAYHGSFYANPQTFDMERIEVLVDNPPPALLLSSASDKIDYAQAHIGDGDFLLPSGSELSMVDMNGAENRNQMRFTSCREFSGESVITFDEAPGATPSDKAPVPTREFDLPEGLELSLVLTREIDLKTAAIGDPIEARVKQDVKQKGEIVVPKGALASGRITRLERYDNYWLVGVEFPEVAAPGILARMKGDLDHAVGITPLSPRRPFRLRTRQLPGEGVFQVNLFQRHLPKGCIMFWRT